MQPSTLYNFVRSRQLEGTYPGEAWVGSWPITWNRTVYGWGRIPEELWPFKAGFHSQEPETADEVAKRYRIGRYQRVRGSADCRRILAYNDVNKLELKRRREAGITPLLSVKASFEITRSFVDARLGIIPQPPEDAQVIGGHGVEILKDMKSQKSLWFQNSWGSGWGNGGYGQLSYDFFDEWMIESWTADELIRPEYQTVNAEVRTWSEPDPLGTSFFGVEIGSVPEDERMGWAFAVARGEFFDVEEIYVKPAHRGRGVGTRLCLTIDEMSRKSGLKIRAWVPFVDAAESNRSALTSLMKKLGLSPEKSGVPWAAYRALPGEFRGFDLVRIPPVPAYSKDAGVVPTAAVGHGEGTAATEAEGWARLAKKARLARVREDID